MPKSKIILPLQSNNLEEVLGLLFTCFPEAKQDDSFIPGWTFLLKDTDPNQVAFGLFIDKELVGVISYTNGEIGNLCIKESFRKHGNGKKLFRKMVTFCNEKGLNCFIRSTNDTILKLASKLKIEVHNAI